MIDRSTASRIDNVLEMFECESLRLKNNKGESTAVYLSKC